MIEDLVLPIVRLASKAKLDLPCQKSGEEALCVDGKAHGVDGIHVEDLFEPTGRRRKQSEVKLGEWRELGRDYGDVAKKKAKGKSTHEKQRSFEELEEMERQGIKKWH